MIPQTRTDAELTDAAAAAWSAFSNVRMQMFHGTRRSCALEIRKSGFAPRPVMEQLRSVAEDHGLTVEEVIADLEKHGRFAIADPRPDTIYLVGDQNRAASWADRAPEATWEALWAVYRIRHPHVEVDWNQSDEGHLWVLANRLQDPPVVVEIEAPVGKLQTMHGDTAAEEALNRLSPGMSLQDAISPLYAEPEWKIDPSAAVFVNVTEVPQRVDGPLVRFMSGEDEDTFYRQLDAGFWGEPAGIHHGIPWHSYRDVWERLGADRRAELEEMVGLPLSPGD